MTRAYGRNKPYAADLHEVVLLRRLHPDGKQMMATSTVWLRPSTRGGGGRLFATHTATDRRREHRIDKSYFQVRHDLPRRYVNLRGRLFEGGRRALLADKDQGLESYRDAPLEDHTHY